jgi:hypothetical protein
MTQPGTAPSELDGIIREFAKRMRMVALGVVLCSGLLAVPLLWSSDPRSPSLALQATLQAGEIATWSYLAVILVQFYRRTRLREYVLQYHAYWLSGVIAYPVSKLLGGGLLLIRSSILSGLYQTSAYAVGWTWLVLLLVGGALRRHRATQMQEESHANAALWQRLHSIDKKDILLLRFPTAP